MTVIGNVSRPDEPAFEIQMRGYCRSQVDSYVTAIRWENNQLRADLTRTQQEAAGAQEELAAVGGPDVQYERLSGRLGEIWRLAAEEAAQKRAQADAEISDRHSRSLQQIEQLESEARSRAESRLAEARAEADMIQAAARAEASSLVDAARDQADRTVAGARGSAERMLAEAHQRATVVNEEAANRLHDLTGRHGRTVRDLTTIHEALSTLMKSGALSGPLVSEDIDLGYVPRPALPQLAEGEAAQDAAQDGEPVRQIRGEVEAAGEAGSRLVG